VLEAGETDDVIGDVFMAAASAGLFVHTLEGKRVLFDVSPAEAARRCKRIPLLPRRTYHVALVGFAEGDGLVEAAWSTARVDARLGFLVLDITGGGFVGERRIKLGDGLFQRKAPGSSAAALAAAQAAEAAAQAAAVARQVSHPAPGTGGHGISVSTSSPMGEFDRQPPPPGFAPPLWEWVAADASLASTFATTAATVSAAGEAAAAAAALTPGAAAAAVAAATAASIGPDRWPHERGLNVLAIRLEDLKVVYDRTFDTYGFKRKSSTECAALRAASGPDGELGLQGPLRWRWRDHLLIVTSSGTGWEATPDSDITAAAEALMQALGASPSVCQAVARAAIIGPLNKSGGRALAALGLCGRAPLVPPPRGSAARETPSPGRVPGVTAVAAVSPSLKDPASVRLALACDAAGWFPTFVCAPHDGRWVPAWSAWGDEPWDLAQGLPSAERQRVERYLLLLDELAPMLTSQPGGHGTHTSGQQHHGLGRASLAPLLGCLSSFATRHMAHRGWPLMHRGSSSSSGLRPHSAEQSSGASQHARRSTTGKEAPQTETHILEERGDQLVVAFERLLERLLLCDTGRASKVTSDAAMAVAEAACEMVDASVVEYLCARLSSIVHIVYHGAALGASALPAGRGNPADDVLGMLTGGVLRVRTTAADVPGAGDAGQKQTGGFSRSAAISEGRRICRILCRCMTADSCVLLAEAVCRGALPSVLSAAATWLPAAPYNPQVPSTWATPHPGDVEEVLYRAAALDITTLTMRIRPPTPDAAGTNKAGMSGVDDAVAALAWEPLDVCVIRTGLTVIKPRAASLASAGSQAHGGFAGPLRVIEHVAPKKGQPITLTPALPHAGASEAGALVAASPAEPPPTSRPDSPTAGAPSSNTPTTAAADAAAAAAAAAHASLKGCVLLFRAKDAASAASLVLHAPRLAYLASCAGAAGCVFVSQRARGVGVVRPLLANPNYDTPTVTPSVCAPGTTHLDAIMDAITRVHATWTATVDVGGPCPWGSASDIAAALGPKCVALAAGGETPRSPGQHGDATVSSMPSAAALVAGEGSPQSSLTIATPHRPWQSVANPRTGETDDDDASPFGRMLQQPRWQSASSPRRGEPSPLGRESPRSALAGMFSPTTGVATPTPQHRIAGEVQQPASPDGSASERSTPALRNGRNSGGFGPHDLVDEDYRGAMMPSTSITSPGYWTEQLGPVLGSGLDAVVAEQMAMLTRAGTCWDGTTSLSLFPADTTVTAANALANALSQALTNALAQAEGGDVAAAAATAAAAAQAVFGATSAWSVGDSAAGGAGTSSSTAHSAADVSRMLPSTDGGSGDPDGADPVREAAARFLASLTTGQQGGSPPQGGDVTKTSPGTDGKDALLPPHAAPAVPWGPALQNALNGPPFDDPVRAAAARILNALGAPRRLLAPSHGVASPQLQAGRSIGGTPAVRPVRVLALDGGGVRGLVEIGILRSLLATAQAAWPQAQQPGAPPLHLCDLFDLVVGTSTGGIIAAGLASGLSLDDLEKVYRETATVIFKPESYANLLRNYGPGATSARAMEAVLRARLGPAADAPLASVSWGPTRRARGLPRPHLCLVSQLASRAPCSTFLLRSYGYATAPGGGGRGGGIGQMAGGASTGGPAAQTATVWGGPGWASSRLAGDSGLSLLDSLRATSAAPWYMEEVTVLKDLRTGDVYSPGGGGIGQPPEGAVTAQLRLIDGGIVCNNPADVAIHEARLLFGRDRPLVLVSVGSGCGVAAETPVGGSSYLPSWLQTLVNAIGDVHQTDATVAHLLGTGDMYWRFNPVGDAFGVSLDDAREESLHTLAAASQAYADSQAHELAQVVSALVPR